LGTSGCGRSRRGHSWCILQSRWRRWNLSSCRRALLRERRLLCRAHAVSNVAGQSGGQGFHAHLARVYDLGRLAGIIAWRGTARLGIGHDERYLEGGNIVSTGYVGGAFGGEKIFFAPPGWE